MPSTSNASALSIVLGTTLAVGTISSLGWWYYFTTKNNRATDNDACSSSNSNNDGSLIKPPFPQTLRDMLSRCQLAYLSTVDTSACSSHLSLMRFTYLHDETDGEIVVMSTNRNTKKFDMLQQQKGVALLVHDFDSASQQTQRRSITLNGTCRILDGSSEEKYRRAHLAHNPEYPQFIVGPDIAVLCIDVQSARICDLNDKVIHWNVLENSNAK